MCDRFQIPHSQFLAWSEDDQDKALEFAAHQRRHRAARCPSCGTDPGDWTDERGRPLAEPAWIPEAKECHGCKVIDSARNDIPEDQRPVTHIHLRPSRLEDFIDLDE